MKWQRIETAPRNNPRCLTYDGNGEDYDDATKHPIRICPAGLIHTHSYATHWMPLPEPPEEE